MEREINQNNKEQAFLLKCNYQILELLQANQLYIHVLHNYYKDTVFSLKQFMRILRKVQQKLPTFSSQKQMDYYFAQEILILLWCKIGVEENAEKREELLDCLIYSTPCLDAHLDTGLISLWIDW